MQNFIRRSPLVAAVALATLGLCILKLVEKLFSFFPKAESMGSPIYVIGYVLIIAATIGLLHIFGLARSIRFNSGGYRAGWPMLAGGLLAFIATFLLRDQAITSFPAVPAIIWYALTCLGIGIFEELLTRAGVLRLCLESLRPKQAIFISSAIFGLLHFANLAGQPHMLIGTTTQVIYAFLIGLFLGYLYLRTQNILVCAVWHGIFDFFGGFVSQLMYPPAQAAGADIPIFAAILQLLVISPIPIAAILWIRRDSQQLKDDVQRLLA